MLSAIPMRWRGGSNPGGIGHDYVKTRYIKAPDGSNPATPERQFFPAKLDDIKDAPMPVDPATGKAFLYKLTDDKAMLEAVPLETLARFVTTDVYPLQAGGLGPGLYRGTFNYRKSARPRDALVLVREDASNARAPAATRVLSLPREPLLQADD